jgi:hypothetical protein
LKADLGQRTADLPGAQPVKDAPVVAGAAKAEAPDQAKPADPPGAQAPDPAQPAAAAKGGDASPTPGAVLAGLPTDPLAVHVTGLWPDGQSPAPAPETAMSSVPQAAVPAAANGAQGGAGLAAAGLPGDAALSVSFGFGETGKGAASVLAGKAADAGAAGTGPQTAKPSAAPNDVAESVLSAPPAAHGPDGKVLALGEVLAVFSAAPPEGAGGQQKGKGLLSEHVVLEVPTLESGASHPATNDLALL